MSNVVRALGPGWDVKGKPQRSQGQGILQHSMGRVCAVEFELAGAFGGGSTGNGNDKGQKPRHSIF